jgi:penicillin-binding protein 1A
MKRSPLESQKGKTSRPPEKRPSLAHRKAFFLLALLSVLAVAGMVAVGVLATIYFGWSLTFDLKEVGKIPERSWVYDMDGKVYSRLRGENRILVEPQNVSPFFKKALLAREDSRFYEHHGIDPIGITRALLRDLGHMHIREGGSTITQQLARNSFALGGRDLNRKILEAFVAFRIESSYSKDQILGFYINRIYFGSGLYGLETASRAYFGKPSSELTLQESAMLAGLIRSPNRYSPLSNMDGAVSQRDEVLNRMVELKMISAAEANDAKKIPGHLAGKRNTTPQENYAMDALYRELQGLVSQDQIDGGGLRVYTSLDPDLQQSAEQSVENGLTQIEKRKGYNHPRKTDFSDQARAAEEQPPYLQGALIVIDNRTGGIRALVGGRDYRDSKYNRALQANRQVGSTFKPFVYLSALARGVMPGTAIDDGALRPGEISAAPHWNPSNSDGSNNGFRPARDGLILSRNTMTIRVGELATLDRVVDTGQTAGFAEKIPKNPASYIGTFDSSLKNVTAAYSTFPSHGQLKDPYLIERIDDSEGRIIYQAHPHQKTAFSPALAWVVCQMLRAVIERGTAAPAKSMGLTRYAAGKTGTTDDYKDAWFVGFTNSLTCGVWVGFDQPQTIQERGYGAALALPIWVHTMEKASRNKYPDGQFPAPEPLVHVQLCSVSSHLATDACASARTSYEIVLPQSLVPNQSCQVHQGRQFGSMEDRPDEHDSFPSRLFRSLRHLFGE